MILRGRRPARVPNEKNLIPNDKRTPSERRKNASKAGKASGESRRQRKALRESMETLLSLTPGNAKDWNALARIGFDPDEGYDNSMLIVLGLFNRAKTGDVAAIKELRGMIGEDRDAADIGHLEDLMQGLIDEV